ncbi:MULTISPECIES: HAMP domain-containing sensor histidine kinase [Pectobacterium]|uniref:histidine kinase n=1 Tax=Pectobacterium aquaticum TaxID=2204145 RepID=A0AA93AQC0_9GAMM|nr:MULTISPECIES: HAMP domain-containing sensor histidine kinase [Pectobacterium]MBA0173810.1 HAMP domain-containing histidine kinase [Pectobacterium versatile]QQG27683.1 HAMP domain-containing histidine kinase [Pectobacterium carotovorum]RRO05166.1 HAMP domain-containing histidine kinase [Pectobacterium aquaticum]RRO25335.1 HAMP domain-containing histidine kinase [Pectobacterium aquaticum]
MLDDKNRWNFIDYLARSLSFRLWLTSVAVLTVSLSIITSLVLYAFNRFPLEMWQMDDNFQTAVSVSSGLQYDKEGQPVSIIVDDQTGWLFEIASTEIMYRVLDSNGQIILSSEKDTHDSWGVKKLDESVGIHQQIILDNRYFDLFTTKAHHGNNVFYVQTITSNTFGKRAVDIKLENLPNAVCITILIAIIGFGVMFPFTIRLILRPLSAASNAAMLITPTNLITRLYENDIPSEIKPLIVAFNDTLERLEKGFIAQQEFLGCAAHELKTPLTLLRGQIELQSDIKNKDFLFREIDLMARQVHQLLHLAEVSETQNYTYENVDRIGIVHDVIKYLALKADHHQVKLCVEAPHMLPFIQADKSALFILLKNIIENAINASPDHSTVTIKINALSMHIQDNGSGILSEDIPFLFDRFWRVPNAKHGGTGLGLAICKEIVQAHKWRISVNSNYHITEFVIYF